MPTERLYYADAYLREFDATVVAHGGVGGRPAVALDRSAFYPEGGGQPGDTGALDACAVADTQAEGELVWHILARPEDLAALPVGVPVAGRIDWARRFDHMQQHCGQHILTAAFIAAAGLPTISFHLGAASVTIDLDTPELTPAQARAAEELANAVVWEDRPVTARFVGAEELARLPLRKAPTVAGPVRVVSVEGFDHSACGGTHPRSTGGGGLIPGPRGPRPRGGPAGELPLGGRGPAGTVVRATIAGEPYEVALARPGQRLLVARGGRGGLGNVHFTTSVRQAPRIAELGEPGQELTLELELKLIADVGLVGFPNAGKSTLLSVISAAKPKIANYPFTTLQPNLGLVDVGERDRFVVADIPGLIEGAHAGVGLGHDFLRHVERTRVLIHVVDAAGVDGRDPADDFRQINEELRLYQPALAERPQVVALNKVDLPEARENLPRLRRELHAPADDLFPIAAATREGVDELLRRVAGLLRELPAPALEPVEADEPPLTWPLPEVDENQFTVEREGERWRVRGVKIERLMKMTNFAQPEAVDRMQRVLDATGISQALVDAGLQEGDLVAIGDTELEWDSLRFE